MNNKPPYANMIPNMVWFMRTHTEEQQAKYLAEKLELVFKMGVMEGSSDVAIADLPWDELLEMDKYKDRIKELEGVLTMWRNAITSHLEERILP